MEVDPVPAQAAQPTLAERLPAELPALRRHVARLVAGDPTLDPEDLVQETVTRALAYADAHDSERALGPWLRRAAVHVLIDARARAGRAPRTLAREPVDGPVDAGRDPREDLDRAEEVERLLARLAPLERELLDRFHRGGETLPDLARELGLPLGTVKARLHRARRRLAEGGEA